MPIVNSNSVLADHQRPTTASSPTAARVALNLTGTETYYGATNLNGGITTLSGTNGGFTFSTQVVQANTVTTNSTVLNVTGITGLTNGMAVTGPGIAPGTTISANPSGTAITLSTAASVASGATITFGGTTSVTVNAGASLVLDSFGGGTGSNFAPVGGYGNRLGDHPVVLAGGATLSLLGNTAGTVEGTAGQAGSLTVNSGQNVVNVTNNSGTTMLNFTTLVLERRQQLGQLHGVSSASAPLPIRWTSV